MATIATKTPKTTVELPANKEKSDATERRLRAVFSETMSGKKSVNVSDGDVPNSEYFNTGKCVSAANGFVTPLERCVICRCRDFTPDQRETITFEHDGETVTRWICASCHIALATDWWDDGPDHNQGELP